MKKIVIGIAIIIGVIVFVYLSVPKINKDHIEVSGIIEATEINLSAKISGRISNIGFKEGDTIKKGDMAVRLDDSELAAQLNEAEAELQNAVVSLNNAEANVETGKANIRIAEANIDKGRVAFEEAKREFDRADNLLRQGFISQQGYDSLYSAMKREEAELSADAANKEFSEAQFKAAVSQRDSAKTRIEKTKATLDLIKARYEDTIIRSPISGIITKKYFEEGEIVGAAVPIITIIDKNYLWARVNLEERLIDKVKIDMETLIRPSFNKEKTYKGRIMEIGSEGIFATQRDVTRGKQDIKTFRVKVEVIDNDGGLKNGMTVDVIMNPIPDKSN